MSKLVKVSEEPSLYILTGSLKIRSGPGPVWLLSYVSPLAPSGLVILLYQGLRNHTSFYTLTKYFLDALKTLQSVS